MKGVIRFYHCALLGNNFQLLVKWLGQVVTGPALFSPKALAIGVSTASTVALWLLGFALFTAPFHFPANHSGPKSYL
jgi:hypothetical protein